MGHIATPFPDAGMIDTFSQPALQPVGQTLHTSPWTARSFAYSRGARWEGTVVIRPFGTKIEAADKVFPSWRLNQLMGGLNTFLLQLPIGTIPFRAADRDVSSYAIDADTALLEWTAPATEDVDGVVAGQFCQINNRVYQIAGIAGLVVSLTPGIEPAATTDLPQSLRPAADDSPQIRVRATSLNTGVLERQRYLSGMQFQWTESLDG